VKLFASLYCIAQIPAAPSGFEVASIHAVKLEPGPVQTNIGTAHGVLRMHNVPLRLCIEWAWNVRGFRVAGPDWLNDVRFDIVAKAGEKNDDAKLRVMTRGLLVERLGLRFHSEQKEMRAYVLTVTKGGPRFHESKDDGPTSFSRTKSTLIGKHAPMSAVVEQLERILNRPVVDQTGLKGRYDLSIDVSPFLTAIGGDNEFLEEIAGFFVTAIPEQLGLKMEMRKTKIDVLTVDHAEKTPTDN
jgi:uncharacterized protein (TIGR03435 family)